MATLHKHGRLIGVYVIGKDRTRLACFENGTVLRNRPNGMGGWQGWRKSAFNAQRLLSGSLLTPDHSDAALAIVTRVNRDSYVHEGAKLRRRIERSYR